MPQLKRHDEIYCESATGSVVTIINVLEMLLHRDMMEILTF
jgi:hypothetical protein